MSQAKTCDKCKHFVYCDFAKITFITQSRTECDEWEENTIKEKEQKCYEVHNEK